MVIAMFGPIAALIGVPVAAWYYRRGAGPAVWFGAGACLTFSFLSVWAMPGRAHAQFGTHSQHPAFCFVSVVHVAWAALWVVWARYSRHRVSAEQSRRRSGTTAWW